MSCSFLVIILFYCSIALSCVLLRLYIIRGIVSGHLDNSGVRSGIGSSGIDFMSFFIEFLVLSLTCHCGNLCCKNCILGIGYCVTWSFVYKCVLY